jgi:hypothetical protein
MPVEFSIGDTLYRTKTKLNARQQFHVARRLAPLISQLATFGPMIAQALSGDASPEATEALIMPLTRALSGMSDQDCDYVLDACLAVVQRGQGGNGAGPALFADIWSPRAGKLMFEDIQLPEMLQIAAEVLRENLTGFFAISPNGPNLSAAAGTVAALHS